MKTENVVCIGTDIIKLTDFGLSAPKNLRTTLRGSPLFIPPELFICWFHNKLNVPPYHSYTDMWGFGEMAYMMLFKCFDEARWPAYKMAQSNAGHGRRSRDKNLLLERYQREVQKFEDSLQSDPHPACKWLRTIMKVDHTKRASASETLALLKASADAIIHHKDQAPVPLPKDPPAAKEIPVSMPTSQPPPAAQAAAPALESREREAQKRNLNESRILEDDDGFVLVENRPDAVGQQPSAPTGYLGNCTLQ